jgi:acetylserotonin O-methyltransferase
MIEDGKRSFALYAAVKLGIFDGVRPSGIAGQDLLNACVAMSLLVRSGDSYHNTLSADRYLTSKSPESFRGHCLYTATIVSSLWPHLADAISDGSPRWTQAFGARGDVVHDAIYSSEEFLLGMHGVGLIASRRIARFVNLSSVNSLVDLGGATGHFAAALRQIYPHVQATVFDAPHVVAMARKHYGDDLNWVGGDFWVDRLPPADVYALGRILHSKRDSEILELLQRVHQALPPGGMLVIIEALVDDGRGGPLGALLQSLNMLVCTGGYERSLEEYGRLLNSAGFTISQTYRTGARLDLLIAHG